MKQPGTGRAIAPLGIRLFGPLDVQIGGEAVRGLGLRKAHWLFALLVLRNERAVERSWFAEALWPEQAVFGSDIDRALDCLRQSLAHLRKTLGHQADRIRAPRPRALWLDLKGADVDVVAFDQAVRRGDPRSLEVAIDLYRGPLLEDCGEPWILPYREHRRYAYLKALETLSQHCSATHDDEGAIRYLRLAVAADPGGETHHRALMAMLQKTGDYTGAVEVYRCLRDYLHREANVRPSTETTALFHGIREDARARASHIVSPPPEPASSPPIRNLPRPLTELIGRIEELTAIRERFQSARLVTLLGAGGIGKTRLAVRAAEECSEEYADGVCFVDLAPLAGSGYVEQAVASALDVCGTAGQTLLETVAKHLSTRSLLLVFDACEHLAGACSTLTEALLQSCPHIRILATSRHILGTPGESIIPVPPLDLPPVERNLRADDASVSASVKLFTVRAEAAGGRFVLTDENARIVADVCRRLDGMPLALELAAARTRALTVHEIAERLQDRFQLLEANIGDTQSGQRTLRTTLDWSYDLLTETERRTLCRLSVFNGGWNLEAAESVCGNGQHGEQLLDLLTRLIEKSLILTETKANRMRYRMLDTIREYARVRLDGGPDSLSLHEKHGSYFVTFAEQVEPGLSSSDQPIWLDRLESEYGNSSAALTWLASKPEHRTDALRLAVALSRFWEVRGYIGQGRTQLGALLDAAPDDPPDILTAKALNAAGTLARRQTDVETADTYYRRAEAIYRLLGNEKGIADVVNNRGIVCDLAGDYEAARALYLESLALKQKLNDRRGIATTLDNLGILAMNTGDFQGARAYLEEGLSIRRELGDPSRLASSLTNLGEALRQLGLGHQARAYLEECHRIGQEIQDPLFVAAALCNLGALDLDVGDARSALDRLTESVRMAKDLGDRHGESACLLTLGRIHYRRGDNESAFSSYKASVHLCFSLKDIGGIAEALEGLGSVALARGWPFKAVRLFGAAEAQRVSASVALWPADRKLQEEDFAAVRAAVPVELFQTGWESGSTLSAAEAIEEALTMRESAGLTRVYRSD